MSSNPIDEQIYDTKLTQQDANSISNDWHGHILTLRSVNKYDDQDNFAKIIRDHQHLKKLNICNNSLSTNALKIIFSSTKITALTFSHNCTNEIPKLHRAINNTLTYLDLSNNQLGSNEAQKIADALKNNICLKVLSLTHNNLGPTETELIANSIINNKTLTSLNVEDNPIGQAGATALRIMMNSNRYITTLSLDQPSKSTFAPDTYQSIRRNIFFNKYHTFPPTINDAFDKTTIKYAEKLSNTELDDTEFKILSFWLLDRARKSFESIYYPPDHKPPRLPMWTVPFKVMEIVAPILPKLDLAHPIKQLLITRVLHTYLDLGILYLQDSADLVYLFDERVKKLIEQLNEVKSTSRNDMVSFESLFVIKNLNFVTKHTTTFVKTILNIIPIIANLITAGALHNPAGIVSNSIALVSYISSIEWQKLISEKWSMDCIFIRQFYYRAMHESEYLKTMQKFVETKMNPSDELYYSYIEGLGEVAKWGSTPKIRKEAWELLFDYVENKSGLLKKVQTPSYHNSNAMICKIAQILMELRYSDGIADEVRGKVDPILPQQTAQSIRLHLELNNYRVKCSSTSNDDRYDSSVVYWKYCTDEFGEPTSCSLFDKNCSNELENTASSSSNPQEILLVQRKKLQKKITDMCNQLLNSSSPINLQLLEKGEMRLTVGEKIDLDENILINLAEELINKTTNENKIDQFHQKIKLYQTSQEIKSYINDGKIALRKNIDEAQEYYSKAKSLMNENFHLIACKELLEEFRKEILEVFKTGYK